MFGLGWPELLIVLVIFTSFTVVWLFLRRRR